jgi:hypothetical protein
MEPDLFEQAKDGTEQLGKAIIAIPDPTQSVFFGVLGSTPSFYYLLCEELLYQEDEATLHKMVGQVITQIMTQLKACGSLPKNNLLPGFNIPSFFCRSLRLPLPERLFLNCGLLSAFGFLSGSHVETYLSWYTRGENPSFAENLSSLADNSPSIVKILDGY